MEKPKPKDYGYNKKYGFKNGWPDKESLQAYRTVSTTATGARTLRT